MVRWSRQWSKERILEERKKRTSEIEQYYSRKKYDKEEEDDLEYDGTSMLSKVVMRIRKKLGW